MEDVTKVCRNISELTPKAQKACNLFLARCKDSGLNVLITETYRSQARQNFLYEQGRTRPGNKVTWTKNSRHTSRRAWDICKNVRGQEYSDANFFKDCGAVAKSLGITWGGEWKTPDTPHFEIDENWEEAKEEIDMEELERLREENEYLKKAMDRMGDRVTELENPMIYNYIDKNMPNWAVPTVQKMVDKDILCGNQNGELRLSEEMLRIFVILDRSNAFK